MKFHSETLPFSYELRKENGFVHRFFNLLKISVLQSTIMSFITKPVLFCLLYATLSITMTLLNKSILSSFDFNHPIMIIFIQNSISVIMLSIFKEKKYISVGKMDKSKLKLWILLNVFFISMLLTSTLSLRLISIQTSVVFKNCTNIFIALGEFFLYGRVAERGVILSILMMTVGAIIYSISDLNFNLMGYFFSLSNCICIMSYTLFMPIVLKDSNLGSFGRVYYNSLISLPFLLLAIFFTTKDYSQIFSTVNMNGNNTFLLITLLIFSGFVGFFLSFVSFYCIETTSPLTYSMVGSFSKIPLIIFGILIFQTTVTVINSIGIGLSIFAAIVFSITKSSKNKKTISQSSK